MELHNYKATIISVYDGDTCTADIDLGFYMTLRKVKLRLAAIDTEEMRGGTDEQKKKAVEARDWLREQVLNQNVEIKCIGKGKYGRWVVYLYKNIDDTKTNINEHMIKLGLAKPYGE